MSPSTGPPVDHSDYGTLEVAEVPPHTSDKIVYNGQPYQAVGTTYQPSEFYSPHNPSPLEQQAELEAVQPPSITKERRGTRRRTIIIILTIVLIAIAIGLGVGLGVGLTKDDESDDDASESKPVSVESNVPDLPPVDFSPPSGFLPLTGLDTVQWVAEGITYYRVYWQSVDGNIQESSWDSRSMDWNVTSVTKKGRVDDESEDLDVMMNTPIAAAVVHNDFYMDLIFLDSRGILQNLRRSDPESTWYRGALGVKSDLSSGFPQEGSKIALYFESRRLHYHLIYLNQYGNLQHWESEKLGAWNQNSSQIEIPDAEPLPSTGIAIMEVQGAAGISLRAYYATEGHLQEIIYNKNTGGWAAGSQISTSISPSSPPSLAAVSSFDYYSSQQHAQVISSQPQDANYTAGVETFLLDGNSQDFQEFKPDILDGIANFSTIATTANGRLFGVVADIGQEETTVSITQFILDDSGSGWLMVGDLIP